MLWSRWAKRRKPKPAPESGLRSLVLKLRLIGHAFQTNGGGRRTAAWSQG